MVRAGYVLLVLAVLAVLAGLGLRAPELRWLALAGLLLCAVLFAGLLYKPTRWLAALLTVLVLGGAYAGLRPVCVLIPDAELINFSPPVEQRAEVSGIYAMFQQKADGHWYQCKMAVARWFFF